MHRITITCNIEPLVKLVAHQCRCMHLWYQTQFIPYIHHHQGKLSLNRTIATLQTTAMTSLKRCLNLNTFLHRVNIHTNRSREQSTLWMLSAMNNQRALIKHSIKQLVRNRTCTWANSKFHNSEPFRGQLIIHKHLWRQASIQTLKASIKTTISHNDSSMKMSGLKDHLHAQAHWNNLATPWSIRRRNPNQLKFLWSRSWTDFLLLLSANTSRVTNNNQWWQK